jgi:hypothetical protein
MKSRDIVRRYFFGNYLQARELATLVACLGVAVLAAVPGDVSAWVPYLLLSAIVLLSELVVYFWRSKRDIALLAIYEEGDY